MSIRSILHRTPSTASRSRTDRALQRALSRAVTPASREELLTLQASQR